MLDRHAALLVAGLLFPAVAQEAAPPAAFEGCPAPGDEARRREAEAILAKARERAAALDWPAAERHFREAIALDPADPLARYGLGLALMGVKRYPEAARAFEGSRESFRCLAEQTPEERAALERKRDAAIREIRDALRTIETETQRLLSIRGGDVNHDVTRVRAETSRRALYLEERLHELEQWRKRGSLDSRPPAAVSLALGGAHFQAGALEEAEAAFREALATDPRSGDAHNNLAVVLMLTDRAREAEAEVRLAEKAGVKVDPRLRAEIEKRRPPR